LFHYIIVQNISVASKTKKKEKREKKRKSFKKTFIGFYRRKPKQGKI